MDIFHFDNMGKIPDRHIFQRQCFCEDGAGAGARFAHEEPFACQIGKCVDRLCKMVVAGSNGNIFFGTVYAGFIHFFLKIALYDREINRSLVESGKQGLRISIADMKIRIRMQLHKF